MLILGASIKSLFIFIETFKTDEIPSSQINGEKGKNIYFWFLIT